MENCHIFMFFLNDLSTCLKDKIIEFSSTNWIGIDNIQDIYIHPIEQIFK